MTMSVLPPPTNVARPLGSEPETRRNRPPHGASVAAANDGTGDAPVHGANSIPFTRGEASRAILDANSSMPIVEVIRQISIYEAVYSYTEIPAVEIHVQSGRVRAGDEEYSLGDQ